MAPPPTETTLLSTFLLPPAALQQILTLEEFTHLFPKSLQTSQAPAIKSLYRNLQSQRASVIDTVARGIQAETARGLAQRRAVARVRRANGREEGDEEVDVENALFGPLSNLPSSNPHTLKSILPEMEMAAEEVEDEIRRLEEESQQVMEEMSGVVGGLSDLRYGKFGNKDLREQVLDGLERLKGVCVKK